MNTYTQSMAQTVPNDDLAGFLPHRANQNPSNFRNLE